MHVVYPSISLLSIHLPRILTDADVRVFIPHALRVNFETCLGYTLSPGVRALNNSTIVIIFLCRQSCVQKPLLITTELMDRRGAKKELKKVSGMPTLLVLLRAS